MRPGGIGTIVKAHELGKKQKSNFIFLWFSSLE